jgi:hypothetical protein
MDVIRTFRFAISTLLLGALCFFAVAQQRSSYDPASQGKSSKRQQGFVDFTLGRINASNQDYGKCIEESRRLLLQETLKNGYFWSNLIALGLLGCLFIVILGQHRLQVRREWTLAEKLVEYEHALSRANLQVDQASNKNAELIEAVRALGETAIRLPAVPADRLERALLTQPRSRVAVAPPLATVLAGSEQSKPASAHSVSAATKTESVNQMGLFKPDVELIMKVNSLEQQLGHSREEARQLRRQLGETDRRLESEQGKNRSLKGA